MPSARASGKLTLAVRLRPNVVDPISRENSGDNTGTGMPSIHVSPGSRLTITVLPKGAGAENMSRIAMFLPSEKACIPKFVAETMLIAGGGLVRRYSLGSELVERSTRRHRLQRRHFSPRGRDGPV